MSASEQTDNRDQATGIELPSAVRSQLLDPSYWHAGLEQYAHTTNLAVALTDAEGRLLAPIVNPQPLWSLFRAKEPAAAGCPFALAPVKPCTCVADALAKGAMVLARDRTGLVHFAVPLALGEHLLGALLAGQVFDKYPEQLPLEQSAKKFGLAGYEAWQRARLEHLVKTATLEVYAGLLATLGQTFLQNRYHTLREDDRLMEMMRLRDQLVEADHRKDEFLATLAHELRNPLAPIRNSLQILRLSGSDGKVVEQVRETMERQVQHMVRLVDDLMELSRISRGQIELRKEPVELAAVINNALENCRPLLETAGQELTIGLPAEPLLLDADPVRLAQIVANLLNNAIKYTDRGGRIRLTAESAIGDGDGRGQVVLRVRDTGIGIAAEMLPRVFEMFTQVDRSSGRSQGGLGIGLSLVKNLVEMHGGSIHAHSAGLGQGSEFAVRLPVSAEGGPNREGASRSGSGPRTAPLPPRRILVVDDNKDAADSLGMLLRLMGNEVRIVNDGSAALEAVRVYQPAAVVMDIGMPGIDGYEVARQLRRKSELKDVVLIALTGWGQEEDRRCSRAAGFDAHLVKPADCAALQTALANGESSAMG